MEHPRGDRRCPGRPSDGSRINRKVSRERQLFVDGCVTEITLRLSEMLDLYLIGNITGRKGRSRMALKLDPSGIREQIELYPQLLDRFDRVRRNRTNGKHSLTHSGNPD